MSRFVSGGDYVVQYARCNDGFMSASLLPARFVTASTCLALHAIDTWTFAWTHDGAATRRENASKLGWDQDVLAKVTAWCSSAHDVGVVGFPDVFLALEDARRFVARFLAGRDDVLVIGLALPEAAAKKFVARFTPAQGMGEPGAFEALRASAEPAPDGDFLGFDVLGWEEGGCGCHSFVCNALEQTFLERLAARPNANGLYMDAATAARCADLASSPDVGAEPALWQPWRVTRYR